MKHRYLSNVATLSLNQDKCIGCAICIQVCPHQVLVMSDKKVIIQDKDGCMECGACARNCPFSAISVDAGVGCAYAVIRSLLTGGPPNCDCSPNGGNSCF